MGKKAFLVGVETYDMEYSIEYTLKELENLAKANNIEVVGKISQKLDKINPKYYIGSGKIAEIKNECIALDVELVIFDDELTPSQIRNIEKELELEVMDRSLLILDIFSTRANTTEAILETKLAKLKYMLPRLVGLNASLSRQGGGSGATSSKGAGEKQIELDRRRISAEIVQLENKLNKVKQTRKIQRGQRIKTEIPVVSLVGYTNAGKSTTFNTILKHCKIDDSKQVLEKDMLFATLGTSVRAVKLPNKQRILLIDTVGFVSKLPTLLINSFRSTLEEIINSSLIIHVVDISNDHYQQQIEITKNVLDEIGVTDIKELYLLNKCDKKEPPNFFIKGDSINFSNKTNLNVDKLLKYIEDSVINENNTLIDVNIPITDGKTISLIDAYGIIKAKIISKESIYYKAYIPNNVLSKFKDYL